MTNVFLADSQPEDRSVIRGIVEGLKMNVVGDVDNWEALLTQVQNSNSDLLLVDWGLINPKSGATLDQLRKVCPQTVAIILISAMDVDEQAAHSAGVNAFISKNETANQVANLIKKAALM